MKHRCQKRLRVSFDVPAPSVQQPQENAVRCARCAGSGILADKGYCSCPMGRDLAKAMRRKPENGDRIADILKNSV